MLKMFEVLRVRGFKGFLKFLENVPKGQNCASSGWFGVCFGKGKN